ncbi:hypothetical protein [Legionella jordanis]|uniref:Uncharacterized protein n=1 Tax=Legionella jordanis TaxID=456 RepID=A0A0W0VDY8_9GAMM|nr:hypothetical protein [Legionella jordanis]KTD18298.1 hypothetical protein Ljor_2604 [Legionella jordanis]RMX05216.1 hypothetical protein EAW55_00695 [Legionella jordanis]RMX20933.1 hypothetical protein EAS68_06345 [Legionella jordanis]VEH13357.1 Uncharacterised protein [Legionella jordanis]HAT8713700.1 hypothetical protein [Legionella jordanis]
MAFYLFPTEMYGRFKQYTAIYKGLFKKEAEDIKPLEDSYALYTHCTRRYFGLGALLRFIPGTNAYKASQQFCDKLDYYLQKAKKDLNDKTSLDNNYFIETYKKIFQAGLSSYFSFSTGFYNFLLSTMVTFQSVGDTRWATTNGGYLKSLFAQAPVMITLFKLENGAFKLKPKALQSLIWLLFNPLSLLLNTISFIRYGLNALIDVGAHSNSSLYLKISRGLLKILVDLIAAIAYTITSLVKVIVDIPMLLFIRPVLHIVFHVGESIADTIQHRNEKTLILPLSEFQDARMLRRQAKGKENIEAVSKPESYKTVYMGISKQASYDEHGSTGQLIAIRASSKKIKQTEGLLQVMSMFPKQRDDEPYQQQAVEQAKIVLGLS